MKRAETCSWSLCNKLYISPPTYSCASQVYLTLQFSTYIKFHIKTFKTAPTCFDPKLTEDDFRIETCWSDFKCFNVKFYVSALVDLIIKVNITKLLFNSLTGEFLNLCLTQYLSVSQSHLTYSTYCRWESHSVDVGYIVSQDTGTLLTRCTGGCRVLLRYQPYSRTR